ncbi:hypothetical protein P154DRAFT_393585, partial [Amniculicola lignicola CBS 123094]
MSSRQARLRGNLGDSWGDAEYTSESGSEGGASIHTASEIDSDVGSESEFEFQEDHVTRSSSQTPQKTPMKPSTSGRLATASSHSQTTPARRSLKSTPGSQYQSQVEPTFIMPSLSNTADGFYINNNSNGSPFHSSVMRPRLWRYVNLTLQHVVWPVFRYILSVMGMAMNHAKPLFAAAVVVCGIILLLGLTSVYIRNAISTALTPLCLIPGTSYIFPLCDNSHTSIADGHSPAFEELGRVQGAFEDILDSSKTNYGLPSLIKNTESSIRDLRTLVKYSKLPSRTELNAEFDSFIETAGQASHDLTKYNSRIGYTLDQIISTNTWTLNVLQGIESNHASQGSLARFASLINPLSVVWGPEPTLQQLVFDQYVVHVQKNIGAISDLIRQAEALLGILINLEARLDMIYNIAVRDGMKVNANRDELLSQLWTKLGNNKASQRDLNGQLALLAKVHSYRNQAIRHVTNTLMKLKEIEAGLQDLREGVSAPQTLGYRPEHPLGWHIDVVGRQIDRMKVSRGEQIESERASYLNLMNGAGG